LYWGRAANFAKPALSMIDRYDPDGTLHGITQVGSMKFETTGLLGASKDMMGKPSRRAFPTWATIPGARNLAQGRRWHFFFAWLFVINGLCYLAYIVASRHLAGDLWPTRGDLRSIGASIRDHLRFRHAGGEAARRYNVLQKIAYLVVIFVLLPLVVMMGLAMSPRLNTVFTGWVELVGGRQSARTLHFVIAWLLVTFAAIHVFQVIVTGFWNNLRSMITGRYRVPPESAHE
jgi:thiosulfate reductase cytochrome b subunit